MSVKNVPYKVRCRTCGFETMAQIQPAEGVLLEHCPVQPDTCPQCASMPFGFDILAGPFGLGPRQPPALVTQEGVGGTTIVKPASPAPAATQDAASLAAEHGIELSELAGSGAGGTIVLADVYQAMMVQDNAIAERMAKAAAGDQGE